MIDGFIGGDMVEYPARVGLSLLLVSSLAGAGQAPPQDFKISTTSRLVLLDVSVRNSSGGFVSGLTRDNFHVFEDGKPQTITQFANADIPVTIGIAVDESGSMRTKRAEVITAAMGFLSASNPQDEMFVLNFNEKVSHGLPDTVLFSDDYVQLRSALWNGVPQGRTALYDAIVAGLKQLDMGRRDKKSLIIISDGGDNVSTASLKDVMNMVLKSAATVYTIGIYSEDDPDKNPDVLRRLANVSGGEFYQLPKLEEIVPVCQQIAKDIRTRYTIGYIPSESGKPIRHIKVTASSPDHPKLIVHTRTSYKMEEDTADRATGTGGK
jgi:VWFA-related protein